MRLIYLIYILYMTSCTVKKDSAISTTGQKNVHLVASIQKTSCLGKCPVYKAEIFSDRSVNFQGEENVPHRGFKKFMLSDEDYDKIITEFKSTDFFTLENRYYENINDLPTTYLYFNNGTSDKKVMNYYGAPERLNTLQDIVQSTIFTYL